MNVICHIWFIAIVIYVALADDYASDTDLQRDLVGCFLEKANDREFVTHAINYYPSKLSRGLCRMRCFQQRYLYAAVQDGKYCFCSNTYGRHGSASTCTTKCSGDTSATCGGILNNHVYKVPEVISGFHIVDPGLAATFDPLTITVNQTTGIDVKYVHDYNDGSPPSASSSDKTHQHHFLKPGKRVLVSTATDREKNVQRATKVITVQSVARGAEMVCPTHEIVTTEFSCMLRVGQGTNMKIGVDFDDMSTTELPQADASLYELGDIQGSLTDVTYGSSANIIYMMFNRIFKRAGTLVGWQFDVATAGALVFMVFRPNCATTQQFCYRTYSCIALTVNCRQLPNRWGRNCGNSAYYSFSKRVCISKETNQPVPEYFETFWTSFPWKNFKYVGEYGTTATKTGVQFLRIPEADQIQVEQGDIMALRQSNGRVKAIRTPVVYQFYHSPSGSINNRKTSGYSFSNEMSQYFGYHLMRAHVVRPINFKFQHNFKKVGTYNITANITNRVTPAGISATWEIDIQDVIEWVNFTFPFAWPTNSSAPITVSDHPGMLNKVNYTWEFGDGHTLFSTDMNITHNFTKAGIYNITVVANNHVSSASFSAFIIIQDTIKDFVIHPKQIATIYGYQTSVNWTISQGTNVTYDIDMGDTVTYTLTFEHGVTSQPEAVVTAPGHFGKLAYTYAEIGNYTFNVNVSNLISWLVYTVYLPVQIPIEDFRIEPPLPIPYGDEVYIYMNMTNGSHVTFTSDFGGKPTRLFNMSDITRNGWALIEKADYPGIGNYTFTVIAENLVGPAVIEHVTLWIEHPIKNMALFTDLLCVKPNSEVNFAVSVLRASRATLMADYGDGKGDTSYRELMLAKNGDEEPFKHTFGPEGFYTTNINMTNAVSYGNVSQEIIVQNPVVSLKMVATSPIAIWPSSTANVNCTVTYSGSLVPTDASYVYDFGDGYNETKDFVINSTHPVVDVHSYKSFGTYPLTFNASNCVSHVYIEQDVVVDEPIMNLQIQADPLFVEVGEYSNISVTADWGSRFTITVNFDDGKTHTAKFIKGKTNVVRHQFITPKTYNITVVGKNVIGSYTAFLNPPLIIQFPVSATSFRMTGRERSLISAKENWVINVPFKLYYDKAMHFPTDAEYIIYYGDGHQTARTAFKDPTPNAAKATIAPGTNNTREPTDLFKEYSHGYVKGGRYTVIFRIINLVTDVNITFVHDVYEQIYELSKEVYSWDNVSKVEIVGNGTDGDYYPLEDAVLFKTNMTRGSHVSYEWDFGDGSVPQKVYDIPDIKHKFPKPGVYKISLNASNPLNWKQIFKTIRIQKGVFGLGISCDSPRPRNTTFSYQVDPGSIGTDACYMIDFIDETSDGNYIRFYGDEAQCRASHPVEFNTNNRDFTRMTTAELEARKAKNKGNANFTVENVFQTIGAYTVKLVGSNKVKKLTVTWRTGVTKGPCWWPKVDLLKRNKCVEPFCDDNKGLGYKIKTHYRSKILDVESSVEINCTSTKVANFTWQAFRVDEVSLQDAEELDLGSFDVKTTGNSLRTLTIESLTLEYGIYRFYLNVSMFEEFGINSVKSVEVRIIETELQGAFTIGAFIRRRWNTNVTLDAINSFVDPDYPLDKTGFDFTWKCKRACEEWPQLNAENELIPGTEKISCNKTSDDLLHNNYMGGCFYNQKKYVLATSVGQVETTASTNLNESAGVYILDTFKVREPDTIDIRVEITKGSRTLVLETKVDVIEGDPPTLFVVCITNCKKVDPNGRFGLESRVLNWRRGMRFGYEWSLARNPPGSGRSAYEIPLHEWASKCSTGVTSANLAIDGLFTREDAKPQTGMPSPDVFMLMVKAWRLPGGKDNYGLSSYEFLVNEEPLPGNFTVVPSNGTALITEFNIQLVDGEGFVDDDLPLTYKLGYRIYEGNDIIWVYEGNYPSLPKPTMLPAGDPENDYRIEMVLQGADNVGTASQSVSYVYVEMPDPETLSELLVNLTADGGMLDNLITAGDPSAASQVIGAVASAFNTKQDNVTVDLDKPVAPTITEEMTEEELATVYEEYKQNLYQYNLEYDRVSKIQLEENSRMRKKSVVGAAKLAADCQKVSDATVLLSAVSEIVKRPEELDPESQEAAVDVLDYLLAVAVGRGKKDGLSANQQEQVGKMLLVVAGETLRAIQKSLLSPPTKVSVPEGITVPPPTEEELLQEAQAQELYEQGSLQSVRSRDRVMNIITVISENLEQYKVAGESDTIIVTENVKLNVKKQFTERMSSVPLASSEGDGNLFGLPGAGTMFGTGNDTTYFVSAQTTRLNVNPYVQQNTSDAPVVGGVSGLSFKNDTGKDIDISNLDEPINVILTRDEASLNITGIVNATTAPGQEGVVHKISIPGNTALLIKLEEWFNDTSSNDTANNDTSSSTTESSASVTTESNMAANGSHSNAPYTVPTKFTIFFKIDKRPSIRKGDADFNCTVPLSDAEMARLKALYTFSKNQTEEEGDEEAAAPVESPVDKMKPDRNTCFFSNTDLDRNDTITVYYVVKHTDGNDTVQSSDKSSSSLDTADVSSVGEETPAFEPKSYTSKALATACRYWNKEEETWAGDGCTVGPLSNAGQTQCLCTHLTQFGAGFVVPMNAIDVNDSAFLKLNENPVVFATMVCLMALYLVLVIWARKADKQDALKAGASPLLDNDPRDKYLYELTVYTGARKNAATTSKVSFILTGDQADTGPRIIQDEKRKILQRGSIDTFVMAVSRPLGALSHLRLWHDNTGASPSWFFSRMQVTDMQTDAKFFFICDRWFAVEEDDGLIDRILPLAGNQELTSFNHLFWIKTRKNMTDGHIWFSVFNRPAKSRFTRVQRLTCCLSLLFCTMMANILFYNQEPNSPEANVYRVGPLSFTFGQVYIGFISALLVMPVNIIVVAFFRYAKEAPEKKNKKGQQASKYVCENSELNADAAVNDELMKQKQFLDTGDVSKRLLLTPGPGDTNGLGVSYIGRNKSGPSVKMSGKKDEKKKKKFMLPHWCIYIAYVLCLLSVGAAFYLTVEVAGQFGLEKSKEWLIAFTMSILESIFLMQPFKVLALALVYALIIKKPDTEDDEQETTELKGNEEWLHGHLRESDLRDPAAVKKLQSYKNVPLPPDEEFLKAARSERFKEIKMHQILREIFFYLLFLYLLMMVGFGNRDPWSFMMINSYRQTYNYASYDMNNSIHTYGFDKIRDRQSFYNWADAVLIPSVYGETRYSDADKAQSLGFTADRNAWLVGSVRLRQLRIKPEKCFMPVYQFVPECRMDYSFFQQAEINYTKHWIPANMSDPSNPPDKHYIYHEASELDGYPYWGKQAVYSGGGYVVDLGDSMVGARALVSELNAEDWIDEYTRAVFVEFVTYNPNVNLFGVSLSVVEFMPVGGADPFFKFHVMRLDRYSGSFMFVIMGAEILTGLFVLFFIFRESRKIYKERRDYPKDFWNCVEMSVIVCCIVAIVMFMYRLFISSSVSDRIHNLATDGRFVNFQYAVMWDEVYAYFLGIIIFFATIKFLKLLRFNKKMSLLGSTLVYCAKPLLSFTVVFLTVFFAFCQLVYLMLNNLLMDFSTFIRTMETLFSMMLNKFDFYEIRAASPVWGPFILFFFALTVNFVLINFFLTIMMEGFTQVKEDISKQANDYEIVDFMIDRFKTFTGMGENKKKKRRAAMRQPAQESADYVEGVDPDNQTAEELRLRVDEMMARLELLADGDVDEEQIQQEVDKIKNKPRGILVA